MARGMFRFGSRVSAESNSRGTQKTGILGCSCCMYFLRAHRTELSSFGILAPVTMRRRVLQVTFSSALDKWSVIPFRKKRESAEFLVGE